MSLSSPQLCNVIDGSVLDAMGARSVRVSGRPNVRGQSTSLALSCRELAEAWGAKTKSIFGPWRELDQGAH